MGPREQRVLQVVGRCLRANPSVVSRATVQADGGLIEKADAQLEILGIPAFNLEITKAGDPVAQGGKITYKVVVTNRGSLPANAVALTASVTPQLQIIRGRTSRHGQNS